MTITADVDLGHFIKLLFLRLSTLNSLEGQTYFYAHFMRGKPKQPRGVKFLDQQPDWHSNQFVGVFLATTTWCHLVKASKALNRQGRY